MTTTALLDRPRSATVLVRRRSDGHESLPGWLLCNLASLTLDSLDLDEHVSPTCRDRLPLVRIAGFDLHDDLAIVEHLDHHHPEAAVLPTEPAARSACQSVCRQLHGDFEALRAAVPVDLRRGVVHLELWSGAQAELVELIGLWRQCLASGSGPFLFGPRPGAADALSAPLGLRLTGAGLDGDPVVAAYLAALRTMPALQAWISTALAEPADVDRFDMEF